MAIHELAELTWEEVRDLDRARTVAILPVGAVEAHGPHLPLGTDTLIAAAMARAAAGHLSARGWHALLLPAMPYVAAPFAAAFPGTLSLPPDTVSRLLAEIAVETHRQGCAAFAIANAHLDPAHLQALAAAGEAATARGVARWVCPDLTRRAVAERLTAEFRSGACHAGRYEGSVVLAVRPDLVREPIRAALPPVEASLVTAIRAGAPDFAAAGGPRAYFGWPADATAEEGRATIATLGAVLAEAILAALPAEGGA
jgi:creatinine amidohydrolase